jgi:hypothetical protein
MTDGETALRELLAKGTDASFLREAAKRLVELEVAGLTGAAHGERSPERLVQLLRQVLRAASPASSATPVSHTRA